MEKRIPLNKIRHIRSFICFFTSFYLLLLQLPAQTPERNTGNLLRFSVGIPLDAFPESPAAAKEYSSPFTYPISQIRELTPFLLEGMLYGWDFSYTPSDTTRGVNEFFSFTPVHSISISDPNLVYTDPWYENNILYCWVEYQRTAAMMEQRKYWDSVTFRKISGTGTGPLEQSVTGIRVACGEALKKAVRAYVRGILKNKPKEINGTVLLSAPPRIYLDHGQFVTDLDFFLYVGTIVPYSQF
jgi:hypothetical protein